MPFSLRLDPETETLLRQLTVRTGRSKAQVVREAVAQYAVDPSTAPAAGGSTFDQLKAYAGIVQTGGADYSIDTHQKYRRSLQQKHREQRPR